MAELADASDLGSDGQPCRFNSCYPYQTKSTCARKCFSFYLLCMAEDLLAGVKRLSIPAGLCLLDSADFLRAERRLPGEFLVGPVKTGILAEPKCFGDGNRLHSAGQ